MVLVPNLWLQQACKMHDRTSEARGQAINHAAFESAADPAYTAVFFCYKLLLNYLFLRTLPSTLLTPSDLLGCDAEGFLPHLTLSGNPLLPGLIRSQTSWAPRVYVARPPLGLRVKQARLTPAHSLPSGLLAGPDHFTVAPPSLETAPPQALMAYPN